MRFDTYPITNAASSYERLRRYPRSLLSVSLTLRHLTPGGVRISPGVSLDVGPGGMGALVRSSLSLGETVAIDLPLAQHTIKTVAIVRHISRTSAGFEFVGLRPQERAEIAAVFGQT